MGNDRDRDSFASWVRQTMIKAGADREMVANFERALRRQWGGTRHYIAKTTRPDRSESFRCGATGVAAPAPIFPFVERDLSVLLEARLALAAERPDHDANEGGDDEPVIDGQFHNAGITFI